VKKLLSHLAAAAVTSGNNTHCPVALSYTSNYTAVLYELRCSQLPRPPSCSPRCLLYSTPRCVVSLDAARPDAGGETALGGEVRLFVSLPQLCRQFRSAPYGLCVSDLPCFRNQQKTLNVFIAVRQLFAARPGCC